jgi:4a-hydroxytetrahydrobiopterin dehydratase
MSKPVKLSAPAIQSKLNQLAGWKYEKGKLYREYHFENFVQAFSFMTACALEAEKMNHHPAWSQTWARVQVTLWTEDLGVVTPLDFDLAEKMETLARPFLLGKK